MAWRLAFGFFLEASQHVRSFQACSCSSDCQTCPVECLAPGLAVVHGEQPGETTQSCRSSLFATEKQQCQGSDMPVCRNSSPFCWVLAFQQELSSGL